MSKVVVEDWIPRESTVDTADGGVATQVTVEHTDEPNNLVTPVDGLAAEVNVAMPDVHVREVYIPGTRGPIGPIGPVGPQGKAFEYEDFTPEQLALLKGEKGDKFTFEDFTPEDIEKILVTQPPLDPSPVELFDSILSEVP